MLDFSRRFLCWMVALNHGRPTASTPMSAGLYFFPRGYGGFVLFGLLSGAEKIRFDGILG
jgi:hypothetical protein